MGRVVTFKIPTRGFSVAKDAFVSLIHLSSLPKYRDYRLEWLSQVLHATVDPSQGFMFIRQAL